MDLHVPLSIANEVFAAFGGSVSPFGPIYPKPSAPVFCVGT